MHSLSLTQLLTQRQREGLPLSSAPSLPPLLGGDLHYHLSQHGVFSEPEMRFYAAEILLGLEHMHSRFVVYRDLKVTLGGRGRPPPGQLLGGGWPREKRSSSAEREGLTACG